MHHVPLWLLQSQGVPEEQWKKWLGKPCMPADPPYFLHPEVPTKTSQLLGSRTLVATFLILINSSVSPRARWLRLRLLRVNLNEWNGSCQLISRLKMAPPCWWIWKMDVAKCRQDPHGPPAGAKVVTWSGDGRSSGVLLNFREVRVVLWPMVLPLRGPGSMSRPDHQKMPHMCWNSCCP